MALGSSKLVHGVPGRLYDGYDGSERAAPPQDFLQQLLAGAPPEVRARAEQFAQERQAAQGQQPAAQ